MKYYEVVIKLTTGWVFAAENEDDAKDAAKEWWMDKDDWEARELLDDDPDIDRVTEMTADEVKDNYNMVYNEEEQGLTYMEDDEDD
jgi:hypothetical protein